MMQLDKLIEANKIATQLKAVDIQAFILKNQKKIEPDMLKLIADQFVSRQKIKTKLPTWYENTNIILPPPLSTEQASSELTAHYKASLISDNQSIGIDLTGGMGIDTSFFATKVKHVTYIEQNSHLVDCATYNFNQLNLRNITCINQDSTKFLDEITQNIDWIYVDPARRDSSKNKVFLIEDCEPNLLTIKGLVLEKASKIFIKYSPLLDIKLAIKQLENVTEVHVVAVENDVKELIFVLEKNPISNPRIISINLSNSKSNQVFQFDFQEEINTELSFSNPQKFIYEPNAAILKAGAFKSIARRFEIQKLASNSHLYTSDFYLENFVGRSFECLGVSKFDKKEIQRFLPNMQANIAVRNFPLKPEEIKKKLGIKDGGDTYLFATELADKSKIILICEKVA